MESYKFLPGANHTAPVQGVLSGIVGAGFWGDHRGMGGNGSGLWDLKVGLRHQPREAGENSSSLEG